MRERKKMNVLRDIIEYEHKLEFKFQVRLEELCLSLIQKILGIVKKFSLAKRTLFERLTYQHTFGNLSFKSGVHKLIHV